jgi:tetratricopeptide (TPR) repeat protein
MSQPIRSRRIALLATAPALLLACAAVPSSFTPDPAAKAPRLEGFGRSDIAIRTRVPQARALFNQGVLQAYAFNEHEAVRMFKAALALDPACAMCAWGVAWQLGPNINDPSRGDVPEALNYVGHALRHAGPATPRERALVESLALRYAHASTARETAPLAGTTCGDKGDGDDEKVHPLDQAYAQRMRALADAYPNDPDIASLYAEAEYIATEGSSHWDAQGRAKGRIGEVTQRVERLLPAHPGHTGLNHYMIHLADAVPVAPRAVAAADRLRALAPNAPHLIHMPAHIYVHVGRYGDAARANEAALAADAAQVATLQAQGFKPSKDWRGHNSHFLWYAALMQGREEPALAAADSLAGGVGK